MTRLVAPCAIAHNFTRHALRTRNGVVTYLLTSRIFRKCRGKYALRNWPKPLEDQDVDVPYAKLGAST